MALILSAFWKPDSDDVEAYGYPIGEAHYQGCFLFKERVLCFDKAFYSSCIDPQCPGMSPKVMLEQSSVPCFIFRCFSGISDVAAWSAVLSILMKMYPDRVARYLYRECVDIRFNVNIFIFVVWIPL